MPLTLGKAERLEARVDVWQVSAHAEHLDQWLQQLLQVSLGHITLDHGLPAVQNSEFRSEMDRNGATEGKSTRGGTLDGDLQGSTGWHLPNPSIVGEE